MKKYYKLPIRLGLKFMYLSLYDDYIILHKQKIQDTF